MKGPEVIDVHFTQTVCVADAGAMLALPEATPTTRELFARYLVYLRQRKRSKKTIQNYECSYRVHLDAHIGNLAPRSLQLSHAVAIHSDLHAKPVAANRAIAALSAALTHAERLGWRELRTNFCHLIERYREVQVDPHITAEELQLLMDSVESLASAEQIPRVCAVMFRLLGYTGCRLSEIQRLKWDQVDLRAGVLRLPETKTGPRIIVLPVPACDLLRRELKRKVGPYVHPGKDVTQPRSEIRRAWAKVIKHSGLKHLRRHDIRHGFATALRNAGVRLEDVQWLLGHSDIRTTQRYAHVSVDNMRTQVDRLFARSSDD